MLFLYQSLKDFGASVKMIYGARSRDEIVFQKRFENAVFLTEDGSYGIQGTVIDGVKKENLDQYEKIYVCGPEGMISELLTIFKRENVLEKSEFSLERYMRCGIGVCGSCVIENGLRVCVDGPVFKGNELF